MFRNLPRTVHIIPIVENHYRQWQHLSWYQSRPATQLEQSVLIDVRSWWVHVKTSICPVFISPSKVTSYAFAGCKLCYFIHSFPSISPLYCSECITLALSWWLSLHVLNKPSFFPKNAVLLWNGVRLYFVLLRTSPRVFTVLKNELTDRNSLIMSVINTRCLNLPTFLGVTFMMIISDIGVNIWWLYVFWCSHDGLNIEVVFYCKLFNFSTYS